MFTATSPTTPACPVCPGRGVPLGQLGTLRWYRCRDCGIDFNRRVKATTNSARRPVGRAS
jgi:tRNA(Ile2) C34 agmatinyltransferase TiaS